MITLRARRESDIEYAKAWFADPDTTRWLLMPYGDGRFRVPEEPASFADVLLTIEADGRPIGTCGLSAGLPEHRRAMAFIAVGDSAYRGRGYGEAAMRALVAFGFGEMNLAKIELEVVADNVRAVAMYERVGFVREVHRRRAIWAHGAWRDEFLMGLLR